ncbi:MAG: 4Fe-4S binding protein [Candidatus Omnitrophica bacterium]|nr:4Fe-4S binding protein [Candidatus Omnitrophota bacterium]
MCEYCIQHGEGKKWYLEMRNYSRELYEQDHRAEYTQKFLIQFEESYGRKIAQLDALQKRPWIYRFVRRLAEKNAKKNHWGQVIPLEDAEKVIDLAHCIVRLPCVCRRLTTGREARYCLGFSVDPPHMLDQFPDYAQYDILDNEEAKNLLRSYDEKGMMHSVWTFKAPYIGGLCNCDQDCLAYRLQVKADMIQCMFRAEYAAVVDWDACNGCKECISQCQFGAMRFSNALGKTTIDLHQCYGCGVCRAACPNGAIDLKPRSEFANLPW